MKVEIKTNRDSEIRVATAPQFNTLSYDVLFDALEGKVVGTIRKVSMKGAKPYVFAPRHAFLWMVSYWTQENLKIIADKLEELNKGN